VRILLAGDRGQLGRELHRLWDGRHEVCGADLPELDIADEAAVRGWFEKVRPDVVVNAAAFTRVDDCETERAAAARANATGSGVLAAAAAARGAALVQVSTDYVFDGNRPAPQPYREDDLPSPVSWYGQTKLDGERAVLAAAPHAWILRTAWLYSAHGRNFPKTMLRLAASRPDRPLRVVNDQFGCPTWARRLAEQIARVIAAAPAPGVYHAVAAGTATWYAFARHFLAEMGIPFRIEPCAATEYPTPARRPHNSILENTRLNAAGINVFPDWHEDVSAFVRAHRAELLAETLTKS